MHTFLPRIVFCAVPVALLAAACGDDPAAPTLPNNLGWVTANRIFVPEYGTNAIRVIDRTTGIITSLVPANLGGFSPDDTAVGSLLTARPVHVVAVDDTTWAFGNSNENCVQGVTDNKVKNLAGTCGTTGFAGDGAAATSAQLGSAATFCHDVDGNVYIADTRGYRIRRVDATTRIITTVTGTGSWSAYSAADDGKAAKDLAAQPAFCATDKPGNLYYSEAGQHVVMKIDTNGIRTTVTGNGTSGFTGDDGPAKDATTNLPLGLTIDRENNQLYFADFNNHVVRKIDLGTGVVTRFAGTGVQGFSGDGGPAKDGQLDRPVNLALSPSGELFIAENHRIRRVNKDGTIETVVGDGTQASAGDGGLATAAQVSAPLDFEDWWD